MDVSQHHFSISIPIISILVLVRMFLYANLLYDLTYAWRYFLLYCLIKFWVEEAFSLGFTVFLMSFVQHVISKTPSGADKELVAANQSPEASQNKQGTIHLSSNVDEKGRLSEVVDQFRDRLQLSEEKKTLTVFEANCISQGGQLVSMPTFGLLLQYAIISHVSHSLPCCSFWHAGQRKLYREIRLHCGI